MSIRIGIRRGELIYLPVRLGHRTSCRRMVIVDTGSRLSIVTPEVAGEIGLEAREEPGRTLVAVAGSAPLRKATVSWVSLFGETVRGLEVICHPLHPALGFHGILGMNFLQHFNVGLDNDSETIEFELRRE